MKLQTQKRLAADVAKCSKNRVKFDASRLDEIKESITKSDIKKLITNKVIKIIPEKGVSRVRANKIRTQKIKGKRKGQGSRKGKQKARLGSKLVWMNKVRLQRTFLRSLREGNYISTKDYQMLYMKIKGGFFRSKNHLKIYLTEHNLIKK